MAAQDFAEFDFSKFLKKSTIIESIPDSRLQFIHLDLKDSTEEIFPDGGQISDYFFLKLHSPEIKVLLILIDRKRKEEWKESNDFVFFQELIEIRAKDINKLRRYNIFKKRGCVWKQIIDYKYICKIIRNNPKNPLESIALNRKAVILETDKPFQLESLKIVKPWGYETWYTGIENRGVVNVLDKHGKTELPYSLNIFKKQILSEFSENLILLKKLNPFPEDVVGDLYFEMHEKKWEVYIVTEIDKSAWPSGEGIIKAGLNPKKISFYKKRYGNNWGNILLKNFKKAIKGYEKIRRVIESSREDVSSELLFKESILRKKAANFVGDCHVKEGDIVSFPVFQIHSLQHGIKVIEFQTPHYERLILMFSQKVLTQNHWDSEEALEKLIPEVYKPPKCQILKKSKDLLLERFVDFPDFTADRISLKPKKCWEEKLNDRYHILITISGQATIFNKIGESFVLRNEEAIFLPVSMGNYSLKNTGEIPLICLKAMPK